MASKRNFTSNPGCYLILKTWLPDFEDLLPDSKDLLPDSGDLLPDSEDLSGSGQVEAGDKDVAGQPEAEGQHGHAPPEPV